MSNTERTAAFPTRAFELLSRIACLTRADLAIADL
jgi:hypothetical protein